MFGEAYWCNACGTTAVDCGHAENKRMKISGTLARTSLLENKKIPEYVMRKEISDMLFAMYKNPKEKLFEEGN